MAKDPDYSKMTFAELLLAFPGWPEGCEPERNRSPGRDVDFSDIADEITPPRARGRDGDPEERKPAPGRRRNPAHDR